MADLNDKLDSKKYNKRIVWENELKAKRKLSRGVGSSRYII